ncbi:MAG: nucleoside hydrolase [Oscillospiraceae bacterium]|nr:nucleoside hydrolase [Oscillospiraceae bacterium]
MKKVILDTDIGSDIDDAIALAYLLRKNDCELLGVTTVSGEADERAKMASAICTNIGKPDIPVYPGTEMPLLTEQKQPIAPQNKYLGGWKYKPNYPRFGAIEFMRQTIRHNPGEVTLLSIGPMTNIGLLFTVDPEIPGMLRELVTMGGIFNNDTAAEWNIFCDPYAAYLACNAKVRVHYLIGGDITGQVRIQTDKEDIKRRFSAPVLRPVVDFTQAWLESTDVITFHDPLAAVTMFRDDVCGFEHGKVEVDCTVNPGATKFIPGDGHHYVAKSVIPDKFFEEFFGTVNDK